MRRKMSSEMMSVSSKFAHRLYMANEALAKHLVEAGKGLDEGGLEAHDIGIGADGSGDVVGAKVGIRAVGTRGEDFPTERRKGLPIGREVVDFALGDAAKHGAVDVVMLDGVAAVNVARNIEVVFVAADFVATHFARIAHLCTTFAIGVGDFLDVAGTEAVLLALLDKTLAGIDDENALITAVFLQDHDERGDARSEEDVGRQADDGVDVVFLNELGANLSFSLSIFTLVGRQESAVGRTEAWGLTTEEHAVGKDDGEDAIGLEMMEFVEEEGIVGLRFRRETILGKANISFLVLGIPVLRIRRIADHGVDGERLGDVVVFLFERPVFVKKLAQRALILSGMMPRMTRFMRVRL